jgi:arylsulfatase A-like enzyme
VKLPIQRPVLAAQAPTRRLIHVILTALMAVSVCHASPGGLPNVVMIMADDLGWSDVAAYRARQGLEVRIPTPNIDRLVAGGMMFTDAHSPCSLCSPTRFAMMTGSLPFRMGKRYGTWSFNETAAVLRNRKHVTVGEIMQTAGYRTSMIGKMHIAGGDTYNFNQPQVPIPTFPTSYGFDHTFVVHDGIQNSPYMYFENDRFSRVNPTNQSAMDGWGTSADLINGTGGSPAGPNGNSSHNAGWRDVNWNSSQNGIINSAKAVEFIDEHLANHPEQPFLLYYNPPQVHLPHTPPIDFEPDSIGNPGSPPNVPVRGTNAAWGGTAHSDMIRELDLQVGRILDKLDDPDGDPQTNNSILADTLIMFTSDNGGLGNDVSTVPPGYKTSGVLRSSKSHSYEGGHRVPFVAHWGDGTPSGSIIAPGSVSDQIIAGHDWVATMYALTGQSIPEDQAMDSMNLLPVLLGQQPESVPVRPFVLHQAGQGNDRPDAFGIRRGDHVLIVNRNFSPRELYNLAEDLSQTTDLINPATYANNTVPPEILALRNELHALFLKHDNVSGLRTTTAFDTDGFAVPPTALAADRVTMTSVTGVAAVDPVEYRFTETTGNFGGTTSGWQTSPVFIDAGLLPNTRYAYKVEVRDGGGIRIPTAEEELEVFTPSVNPYVATPVFSDDFSGSYNPSNVPAGAVKPIGIWHQQDTDGTANVHWSKEDHAVGNSTLFLDLDADDDNEFRIGFAFDEVRVLYNTGTVFDLNRSYTFSGSWGIEATANNHLGFYAGIAEFDAGTGALIQSFGLAPDSGTVAQENVFGRTSGTITVGDTGTFSITVTPAELSAAGIAPGNHAGVYFYRDDDGVLGNDNPAFAGADPNAVSDIYYVDDVSLVTKDGYSTDTDTDGDLIPDSVEDATPGLDKNNPEDGAGDLDGDGRSNASEHLAGTDMQDGADFFAVHAEVMAGDSLGIIVPATSVLEGRVCILEYSLDLGASAKWVAIDAFAPAPAQAGAPYSFITALSGEKAFYRVLVFVSNREKACVLTRGVGFDGRIRRIFGIFWKMWEQAGAGDIVLLIRFDPRRSHESE